MDYTARTVRSNRPGLTQEAALESLYQAYGENLRIASLRQRGEYWVADVKLPKMAEFPPKKDEGGDEGVEIPEDKEEAPEPPDSPDEGGEDGGPPGDDSGGDEKKPPKKGEGGAEHEILNLLHEIATALGVAPMGPKMIPGAEPGPPHPGAPGGPPGGLGGPPGAGGPPPGPPGLGAMGKRPTKLKPGEVLPTQTPIGTPAFSNVHTAGSCPHCGGQTGPDGTCPTCGQNYGAHGGAPGSGGAPTIAGKVASFTATNVTGLTVREAKIELEAIYGPYGYRVKQIREGSTSAGQRELRALLSVR